MRDIVNADLFYFFLMMRFNRFIGFMFVKSFGCFMTTRDFQFFLIVLIINCIHVFIKSSSVHFVVISLEV